MDDKKKNNPSDKTNLKYDSQDITVKKGDFAEVVEKKPGFLKKLKNSFRSFVTNFKKAIQNIKHFFSNIFSSARGKVAVFIFLSLILVAGGVFAGFYIYEKSKEQARKRQEQSALESGKSVAEIIEEGKEGFLSNIVNPTKEKIRNYQHKDKNYDAVSEAIDISDALANEGYYDEAIEVMTTVDERKLDNQEKRIFYDHMAYIYSQKEDQEMVDHYNKVLDSVPLEE